MLDGLSAEAHALLRTSDQRRTGTGPGPSAGIKRRLPSIRRTPRFTTGTPCRAWHCGLSDDECGFERLADGFRDRSFELIFARVDPRFDSLRDDARLTTLI